MRRRINTNWYLFLTRCADSACVEADDAVGELVRFTAVGYDYNRTAVFVKLRQIA